MIDPDAALGLLDLREHLVAQLRELRGAVASLLLLLPALAYRRRLRLGLGRALLGLRAQSDGVTVKASLLWTLRGEIEDAIIEAAPDIEAVVIEGLEAPIAGAMVEAS